MPATDDAIEPWREFLESTPPYTAREVAATKKWAPGSHGSGGHHYYVIENEPIRLHCQNDGGVRWFAPKDHSFVLRSLMHYEFVQYSCRDCGREVKTFAVLVARASEAVDAKVMKLGEYLPFGAP